jgi:hypothetical protein
LSSRSTLERPSRPTKWTYTRPKLARYQIDGLFCPERYAIVEATTKSGKTVGCMAWLFEQAMRGQAGQEFWWTAPILDQARIPYRRIKRGLPQNIITEDDKSHMRLTLANGAALVFKGGDHPDSLYGEDVYAAVIDEGTRCKEEVFDAVRSTLTATRGPLRIIGNVKGRHNWAYMLARKAEAGEPGWHYAKITAYDAVKAGILDSDEIADAKRTLPEQVFRELYLAEPSDDEGNPFGISAIAECTIPALAAGPPVVWGWDLAKSVDHNVGVGLNRAGAVCRFERWQAPWEVTTPRMRQMTAGVQALIDSTGVGDPILEALQKNGGLNFQGFKFSSTSKQQLMEGLALAIQQHQIHFPDGPITTELKEFEYEYTRTGVRYCIDPAMRVLTKDLRWVPANDLHVGDHLLAFDEEATNGPKSRKWRSAQVTDAGQILRPCYRVVLEDGSVLIASQEHLWLVDTGQRRFEWRRTDQLRAPHATSCSPRFAPTRIIRLLDVWDAPSSYEAGYLAAAFDGEGSIQQGLKGSGGHNARLTFAQLENAMAERLRAYLTEFGFTWAECATPSKTTNFGLTGRRPEFLRFLGQIRPARLLAKFDVDKLGSLDKQRSVRVSSLEFLGERRVVALGTTTKTFIAEGFASHNSAPAGLHDDCVTALALAWHHLSSRPRPFTGAVGGTRPSIDAYQRQVADRYAPQRR